MLNAPEDQPPQNKAKQPNKQTRREQIGARLGNKQQTNLAIKLRSQEGKWLWVGSPQRGTRDNIYLSGGI